MENKVLLPQEWPGIHYIDNEEIDAVSRVLKARSPYRYYGPDHQRETYKFEKEFAQFTGTQYCLGVSSGTVALQIAIASLGVGSGDEVIIPGYFWVSTVGAVVRSGAIPVLADVDESLNMDPEDLERKITKRTKLVILVHMGGVIGQVERIATICENNKLLLLEDCAQSVGVFKFGRSCGTYGNMAIFSFQINKNCTAGEGGAIVTNDKTLYTKADAIHDVGYPRDEHGKLVLDDDNHQYWGIGCRMSELTSAVLRVQLKKLPAITKSMRKVKKELLEILSGYSRVKTRRIEDNEGESGGFLKIFFENPQTARQFKNQLIDNGIDVKAGALYPIIMSEWGLHIYYLNNSLVNKRSITGKHSVWEYEENRFAKKYTYEKGSLPHLDDYTERTLLFCIASRLDPEDVIRVKEIFKKTCDQVVPD